MKLVGILIQISLLLFCVSAEAQIHKCQNAYGRISYSENPCPDTQQVVSHELPELALVPAGGQEENYENTDELLAKLFANHISDIQVGGSGKVINILPDDNEGRRHQKFILQLNSGQTLLVSHNIDLAPRIPALAVGDSVSFYGEYEWNAKGGVIHWTHHDPNGKHEAGWLIHNGERYQ